MYLPLNTFSPTIKLGIVSASRNCFPRSLSESRLDKILEVCKRKGLDLEIPEGSKRVIETKDQAIEAAHELHSRGCHAAILFLGNFSPEIEDATFVKHFPGYVMVMAAAEESAQTLACNRGDALCGLLSCMLAIEKRSLTHRVFVPEIPLVNPEIAAQNIAHFRKVVAVAYGIQHATIGLFGPRPRDFETCNYNLASLASIGVEVEELGFFDLVNEVKRQLESDQLRSVIQNMQKEMPSIPSDSEFCKRLAAYELAFLQFRDRLKLSGATSQCWSEQEYALQHVPCYINARLASRGFPVACENDAYSLVAELIGQYASNQSVSILDINHTIPADLHPSLKDYPIEDLVGLFHCGNTDPQRLKNPAMKYQVIMKRLMEPQSEPNITRGTIEGQIQASPITVLQVHGVGDRLRAYICEGEFLDLDPKTFGCTGTAYLPGFARFYRHALLGRFHHHAAVAFDHVGDVVYDALKLLGVQEIYTPNPEYIPYPGENPFSSGFAAAPALCTCDSCMSQDDHTNESNRSCCCGES